MNAQEIVLAIIDGKFDANLEGFRTAVVGRQEILRKEKAMALIANLQRGDRVRFSTFVRPKYLQGKTGTVEKIENGKIFVQPDPGQYLGRFSTRLIHGDATLFEKV